MYKFSLLQKTFKLIILLSFIQINFGQEINKWDSPLEKCWEFQNNQMTNLNIASDNNQTLFLFNKNNEIQAISTVVGKPIWTTKIGGVPTSQMMFNQSKLISLIQYIKKENNDVNNSFNQLTEFTLNSGIISSKLIINSAEQNFYITKNNFDKILTNNKGAIVYIDSKQQIIWTQKLNTTIPFSPIQASQKLILGTSNKTIIIISINNGTIEKQINLQAVPSSINLDAIHKTVYVGDSEGNLYSFDLDKQNLLNWKIKIGGEITSISLSNDKILISSNDNFVYLLSNLNGKKIWKKRLAGRIIGKTMLDENFATFLTNSSNSFEIISLKNGKTSNKILLEDDLYFVSEPLLVDNKLIIPTQKGILAYSPNCK